MLYKKIGQAKLANVVDQLTKQNLIDKVVNLAKVLHALYLVDHPPSALKSAWKKLISSQRKRAVMACFRMLPIHALPRHKVVNLFLENYKVRITSLVIDDVGHVVFWDEYLRCQKDTAVFVMYVIRML